VLPAADPAREHRRTEARWWRELARTAMPRSRLKFAKVARWRPHQGVSQIDRGCVKTLKSQQAGELFSLLPFFRSRPPRYSSSDWRNQEGFSTRRLNACVFAQAGPKAAAQHPETGRSARRVSDDFAQRKVYCRLQIFGGAHWPLAVDASHRAKPNRIEGHSRPRGRAAHRVRPKAVVPNLF